MSAPSPSGRAASECAALVAAAPDTVAGQATREISPDSRFTAAWGDPAIVLRCGGPAPAALRPTSQCFVIDGVGWLVTRHGREIDPATASTGPLEFTTIGRSVYVEVEVPDKYQPAADALVDLASTIKGHTEQPHPCR